MPEMDAAWRLAAWSAVERVLPADAMIDLAPSAPGTGESVFEPKPETVAEETRRCHVLSVYCDLLDPDVSTETRDNALRHLMACDPMRAIGLSAQLIVQMLDDELRPTLTAIRAELTAASTRLHEEAPDA